MGQPRRHQKHLVESPVGVPHGPASSAGVPLPARARRRHTLGGTPLGRKQGRTVLYRLAEDFTEPLRQLINLTRHATDHDDTPT